MWPDIIRIDQIQQVCPSSVLWGSLGLWFPVDYPDSTIVWRPQLWTCVQVFLTSPYTWTLCPKFSLHHCVVDFASPCTRVCLGKARITRSCAAALHHCVTWTGKNVCSVLLVQQAFWAWIWNGFQNIKCFKKLARECHTPHSCTFVSVYDSGYLTLYQCGLKFGFYIRTGRKQINTCIYI